MKNQNKQHHNTKKYGMNLTLINNNSTYTGILLLIILFLVRIIYVLVN